MARVLALNEGWAADDAPQFQVNNDIRGLIDSVNDGSTSAFMWEWFTTKPFADRGEVRFIGAVPTPWPSWQIAASTVPARAPRAALRTFLRRLSAYVVAFDAPAGRARADVDFVVQTFGYPEADVRAWLATVGYPADCGVVPRQDVAQTLAVLVQAGVIKPHPAGADGYKVEDFVDTEVVALV